MSETSGFQISDDAPRHYQDFVAPFMIPLAEALVESVTGEGDAVLDVACGTGVATRIAAEVAAPSGRVVGSDINAAMLAMAEALSAESHPGIDWDLASAADLPYDSDQFDCTLSQQGIQFFPDPAAGLREMARVTKPGGRIGATVWSELSDSPYLEAVVETSIRFFGADRDDLHVARTADEVNEWFRGADLHHTIDKVVVNVHIPPLAEYVPSHMKALPWGDGYTSASPERRIAGIAYMEDRLADYRTPTGLDVPFGTYLATATV